MGKDGRSKRRRREKKIYGKKRREERRERIDLKRRKELIDVWGVI